MDLKEKSKNENYITKMENKREISTEIYANTLGSLS